MATTNRQRLRPWQRRLLVQVRELDPVPAAVSDAAKDSLRWRRVDAELAEVGLDSVSVGGRRLVFVAPRLVVEMSVAPGGRTAGRLVPPQPAHIEVLSLHLDGRAIEADDQGRFTVGDVEPGPLRLRLYLVDRDAAVETEWVVI
ncbi:MAG TPA: hypothetical protein VLL25_17540 [Acidimicrobiales bacterium]|nr:hypothetical protein [Acidimicrobiales bacterium]